MLEYLKKGKARDPNDHANEIYKMEIAVADVKNAILVLMNRIKEQIIYPHALEACNITLIYKKKANITYLIIIECLQTDYSKKYS